MKKKKKKGATWLLLVMAEAYFRYKVDMKEGTARHLKGPPGPGLVREEPGAVAKRTKRASAAKMARLHREESPGEGQPSSAHGLEKSRVGDRACQPGGLEGCWGTLVASVCFVMSMGTSWLTGWV